MGFTLLKPAGSPNVGHRKKAKKNAPRTCDLDIIDFNKLVSKKNAKINLPHKMMHKRNFVLFPLFEIQKNWIHPDKQIDVKKELSTRIISFWINMILSRWY